MSMTMTYWLARAPGGRAEGPYALAQIRAMYESGALTARALCCLEGTEDWREVGEELADAAAMEAAAMRPGGARAGAGSAVVAGMAQSEGRAVRRSRSGCLGMGLFLAGVFSLLFVGPVGLLLILLALVVEHFSTFYACSVCGNELSRTARVCGVCHAGIRGAGWASVGRALLLIVVLMVIVFWVVFRFAGW